LLAKKRMCMPVYTISASHPLNDHSSNTGWNTKMSLDVTKLCDYGFKHHKLVVTMGTKLCDNAFSI